MCLSPGLPGSIFSLPSRPLLQLPCVPEKSVDEACLAEEPLRVEHLEEVEISNLEGAPVQVQHHSLLGELLLPCWGIRASLRDAVPGLGSGQVWHPWSWGSRNSCGRREGSFHPTQWALNNKLSLASRRDVGHPVKLQILLFYWQNGLFLLKMAFLFILKVEEKTAEAAETDAEGTSCSSVGWGEAGDAVPGGGRTELLLSCCQGAGSWLFTGVKHPVGTAQWQYWHCLELALNVQCLVLLIKQSLMWNKSSSSSWRMCRDKKYFLYHFSPFGK